MQGEEFVLNLPSPSKAVKMEIQTMRTVSLNVIMGKLFGQSCRVFNENRSKKIGNWIRNEVCPLPAQNIEQ